MKPTRKSVLRHRKKQRQRSKRFRKINKLALKKENDHAYVPACGGVVPQRESRPHP